MHRRHRVAAAAIALLVGFGAEAHAQSAPFVVTVAQAQPASADQGWSQAVANATVPNWYRRAGEGPFSFRSPLSNLYFIVGGHVGFGRDTTLDDDGGCDPGTTFFINCPNGRPTAGLGTGGGGSIGVGTRLAPALRVAVIATVEGGYRFNNGAWTDLGPGEFTGDTFAERIPIRSFQGSFNAYLDTAGLFAPGALGRWNPYLMGGVGVAANVTSDITEIQQFPGGVATNTFPGATHASFLWTAGIGVQYLLAMGAVVDLGYQYVDAGRFVANADGGGLGAVTGDLRTHRVGLALNIDFNALSRLISGR
jgi:opacity protein-like surface antigen